MTALQGLSKRRDLPVPPGIGRGTNLWALLGRFAQVLVRMQAVPAGTGHMQIPPGPSERCPSAHVIDHCAVTTQPQRDRNGQSRRITSRETQDTEPSPSG
ncbi:predicted protein [Histoplasma capsulatum var. duboisii H88]|uniref:Predicted protein n=2 Tax=Ajellomyces capsulatus TaxID=5037 RepID=F0U5Y6_AJEC8|nr:predicted protein [Histoplasma capsulatum H143]EGC42221.1 predicted protein [Histoplasma capsulatum var. duboisii H88]